MIEAIGYKEVLAVIALGMTVYGYSFYFRDMFAGKTKPHMFSWIIWATLTAIGFVAQISDNAGPGAWITGLTAFISFFIAGYAYFYGEKKITRSDWATFIAAMSAIPIWIITEDALWSVIIITVIDAIGFWPTLRKSWLKPQEETMIHYILAGSKFVLSIIALDNFTTVTVLYPASLVFMNAVAVTLFIWRKRILKIG